MHDPDRDPIDQSRRDMPQATYDARRTAALALVVGVLCVVAIALMFSGTPSNSPDGSSKFRAHTPANPSATQNQ